MLLVVSQSNKQWICNFKYSNLNRFFCHCLRSRTLVLVQMSGKFASDIFVECDKSNINAGCCGETTTTKIRWLSCYIVKLTTIKNVQSRHCFCKLCLAVQSNFAVVFFSVRYMNAYPKLSHSPKPITNSMSIFFFLFPTANNHEIYYSVT